VSIYEHGIGFEVNMAIITIKEVEEVQTYPIGVSPVGTDVTHHSVYIVSTVKTPGLLLGALCVSHIKILSNALDTNIME
jgi:hypothetical protein